MEAWVKLARDNIHREVIHIPLQDVVWIVSIMWILVQIWDKFSGKKK